MWVEAPRTETLIPLQRDRWKRKLLTKAANSDIVYWLEHNRISRRCVRKGGVLNILLIMMYPEELEQVDQRFFSKIVIAKRTIIHDGRMDDGMNDPAERNGERTD